MPRPASSFLAILSLLLPTASSQPVPLWTGKTTGFTHSSGTAASISPDGAILYVTADDGTLIAIDAETGDRLWHRLVGGATSKSGVSFSPDGDEVIFAITNSATTNQIIAVRNAVTLQEVWATAPAFGVVSGTPMYGGSDPTKVYFTSNTADAGGKFTVIDTSSGSPTTMLEETIDDLKVRTGPGEGIDATALTAPLNWSPVGIARSPNPGGNHRYGGDGNTNDLLVWAHLAEDGASVATGFSGYYYAFQMPNDGTTPAVKVLSQNTWATFTPPVFSSDGQQMYFAATRSQIRGWAAEVYNNGADVRINPDRNRGNPTRSAPSITPDDGIAFFGTTRPQFHAVKNEVVPGVDPVPLWSVTGLDDVVEAGSQTSPDSRFVYFFTKSGYGYGVDAATGNVTWVQPVKGPGVADPEGVSAEFSLSPDGGSLYFVGVNGGLSKWRVADAVGGGEGAEGGGVVTPSPTQSPAPTASSAPTGTEAPTSSAPPTEVGTGAPTEMGAVPPNVTNATMAPNVTETEAPTESATMPPTETAMANTSEPTSMPEVTSQPTAVPEEPTAAPEEPTSKPVVEIVTTKAPAPEPATSAPVPKPTFVPTIEPSAGAVTGTAAWAVVAGTVWVALGMLLS